MENKTDIQLPDLPKIKEKPTQAKKTAAKKATLLEERERLPRSNRTIKCAYCSVEKILNPDQYQAYYDFLGSEEKIEREFMCKDCEMESKRNPIKFWYKHGELLQEMSKHIRIAFDMFNRSSKGNAEFNSMRSMVLFHTKEALIDDTNVEFVARQLPNGFPEFHSLKLHKIPHVGTLTIKAYEDKKNRIEIIG
jgi:hypothetical protein